MSERARALRDEFDGTFARPPAPPPERAEERLAIRAGGKEFALRLKDVLRLARVDRLVPAPSKRPEFLGLAAVASEVVPVFSLARMLGLPAGGDESWVALSREGIGWAFPALDAGAAAADRPLLDLDLLARNLHGGRS